MTTIADIYSGAERLINAFIRKEMIAQGHHLTGAMEDSLDSDVFKQKKADVMEGFSVYYTKFVNEGFPAKSASFKQIPFLVEYFIKRGFPIASTTPGTTTAVQMAFATIKKWMKEGMPTQASKRFSSTGSRTNMIENSFEENRAKLDEYMSSGFDFVIDEHYRKEKSETI